MSNLRKTLIERLNITRGERSIDQMTYVTPNGTGPFPAVLYAHAHGGKYDLGRNELSNGAPWLIGPYLPDLIAAGFAVLCIDMPCFGERQIMGSEQALARAGEWYGRPLFGQMISDQLAAYDWLASRPEIDAARIFTLGMSMGAAISMFTTAIEEKIAGCAQICMLADIGPMITLGAHLGHGPYLTIPELPQMGDMGAVAGLIAPRPQFVVHGATDHLTPALARDAALNTLHRAYGSNSAFEHFLDPMTGHQETPQIRAAVLDFLTRIAQNKERTPC